MISQEQFIRLWTEARPAVAAFLHALIPDHHTAEDLLQEVAVVLLRKLADYDPARPFLAWALGVARFELLEHRRHLARSPICVDSDLVGRLADTWAERQPDLEARRAALRDCLRTVGGKTAAMLRLRYEEQLGFDAVAERLGIAAGGVRMALSRARDTLRNCVRDRLLTGGHP